MSVAICAKCDRPFSNTMEKDRVERHLDKVFGESAPAATANLCPHCSAFAQLLVFLDDLKKWRESVELGHGEGAESLGRLLDRGADLATKARAL